LVRQKTGTIDPQSDQVKITLSYTTTSKIFLPRPTLLVSVGVLQIEFVSKQQGNL
jgi:hypothetical protein